MNPYISSGNRKTVDIPTFSLPACLTCPGKTALCKSKCYAKKAERLYPTVLPSRKRDLAASRGRNFVGDMVGLIGHTGCDYFRVHESGDFYSQGYLESWFSIARACQGVRFLAFTKSFHLDYSNAPKNMAIIWSIWPDTDLSKVPVGPRAYAGECHGKRRAIECPGRCDSCGMCWDIKKIRKDVHFKIH